MQNTLALNIPRHGPKMSAYRIALIDVVAGMGATDIWGRLGWRDTKRRYRRTVFGPFWTTVSLGLFVATLGFVWSNLWHKDPRAYLPYLTSGMLNWVFFVAVCTEGCATFIGYEKLIKQLRVSYTLLAFTVVWRNTIVFGHNLITFVLVCIYAGLAPNWATLLFFPGFALMALNAGWIAIVLGTICVRYRDLQLLVANILQISLFLTPIFWSPDQLSGRAAIAAQLNPLFHLISVVRDPLLGVAPTPLNWAAVIGMAFVGWLFAVLLLTRLRHRIVYWL